MTRIPRYSEETRRRLDHVGWLHDPRASQSLETIWTGPDPEGAVERLLDFLEAASVLEVLDDLDATRRLSHLVGASRELMRQLTLHPSWLLGAETGDLIGRARAALAAVAGDDLAGEIDVGVGGRRLSDVADHVVADILTGAADDTSPPLAIMAMGKWGGQEMNYWSDIDLMFVFDGGADAAQAANRTATAVLRRLAGTGPDGVVYQADADLRPEGSRGPLARSLEAYRSYYERWAEPWEFQALLKVRHAAGDAEVAGRFLGLVEEVLWPETIDPDAIRSLRAMKARVEERADPADLKRAPGGIRDIEFSVQMLQLVHGRFDPELRGTSTLPLIGALVEGGYIAPADGVTLESTYRWLRAVEHRLQLWDLRPTHSLPPSDWHRTRIARAMGYRDSAAGSAREAFEQDLVSFRSTVRRIHEDLYFRPLLEAFAASPATGLDRPGAERRLRALGFRDAAAAGRTFEALTTGLSRRSRLMQQMLPLVLDWLADAPDPDLGLDQFRLLLTNAPDHAELITTLHDRPVAGRRLALLLGSSRLLGTYLDRIPELLPRLGDDEAVADLRRQPQLEERLRQRVDSRPEGAERMATLRRFARRQLVRVATRDLLGMADVGDTMIDLTDGADAAARIATDLAGGSEGLAVVAMGRWGGRELAYGSDLDVMFVYDDPLEAADAQEIAAGFRSVLASPAQDGVAWEIDADLRPEGRSGPLARSLKAYQAYYERWAQTWEFQALVKARAVAGDAALGQRFMDMIDPFVWPDRLSGEAVVEIRRMKARIEKERIPRGEDRDFHLKLGRGGLVDIEFLTQLLQLRRGGEHPDVRVTPTIEAIARLTTIGALTAPQAEDLTAAYRFCTHVRNRLYLQVGRRSGSLPIDPGDEWRLAMSLGYRRRGDLREDYRRVTRRSRRVFEDVFYA